jgi:hypothetical protein
MVYTPTGKVVNGWSGVYHILGYSHDITEGKYNTQIQVILPSNHTYNIQDPKEQNADI